MNRTILRNLCLGTLALAMLIVLFIKSQMVDIKEHYRYLDTIRLAQELETSLNEGILKARHAYLMNYDPLVSNLNQLQTMDKRLRHLPAFIREEQAADLAPLLENYRALLNRKKELVERFKSDNAIVHNSMGFFPVAASELAETVGATSPQLASELNALERDMFRYTLYSHPETLQRIEARISQLAKSRELYPRQLEPLERVLNHGRTILRYKGQLDQITAKALQAPSRQALDEISGQYHKSYVENLARANNYRLALYLAAIVLLTGIAYAVLRLRNATVALQQANETLEQKVVERTEELHQTNLELNKQKEQLTQYLFELQTAQQELQRIAVTDELTGLYTRRFLFEWMEKQVANISRNTGSFSCLLLDIDLFKSINDTFGHAEGDKVLMEIAEVMKSSVRQSDIVGRFGGEEFLLLLPNTEKEAAIEVAEKIRKAIGAAVHQPRPVTVSIGVGCCACHDTTNVSHNTSEVISSALESADQALYKAKESGRNQVQAACRVVTLSQFGRTIAKPAKATGS